MQRAGKWTGQMTSPALKCFSSKGTGVYGAAQGKPKPSTCGGWITFGSGNFPAPEEEKESTKMLRRVEKSWVLASLEGQLFLMRKMKTLKRSRWSLEEENLI